MGVWKLNEKEIKRLFYALVMSNYMQISYSGYNIYGLNKSFLSFTCLDINECNTNNGGCSQVCNNQDGSFTCSCNSGFTLEGGNACQDINECASSNGGCIQVCTNTNGSFVCSCNSGYRLSGSTGCTGQHFYNWRDRKYTWRKSLYFITLLLFL